MKHILVNDDLNDFIEQEKDYLVELVKELENDPSEPTQEQLESYAQEAINNDISDFESMVRDYDKYIDFDHIKVVAKLGLWYGERNGQKTFKSLQDCVLKYCEDYNLFFCTRENSTLTLKATHHDGTNIFKYYQVVKGKQRAITINELVKAREKGLSF